MQKIDRSLSKLLNHVEKSIELKEGRKVALYLNGSPYNPHKGHDFISLGDGKVITISVNIVDSNGLTKLNVCWGHISSFMGCCGICIINSVTVAYPYHHKGIGTIFFKFLEDVCKEYSYTNIVCTIISAMKQSMGSILKKSGYREIDSFENTKTDNLVIMYSKDISIYDPKEG